MKKGEREGAKYEGKRRRRGDDERRRREILWIFYSVYVNLPTSTMYKFYTYILT
jgi:hypothetical protein